MSTPPGNPQSRDKAAETTRLPDNESNLSQLVWGGIIDRKRQYASEQKPNTSAKALNPDADAAATGPEPVSLSKEVLAAKSEQLKEALNSGIFTGDGKAVIDSLRLLKYADRQALISVYEGDKPGSFTQDIERRLSAGDRAAVALILQRPEKFTASDVVGNIDQALTLASTDGKRANELIRTSLSTLNKEQIDEFQQAYLARHHQSLADSLKTNQYISADTRAALPIFEKGIDHRSAEDVRQLVDIAVKHHNLQMFSESIGGDSPESKQVRATLQNELKNPHSGFAKSFKELTEPTLITVPNAIGMQSLPPQWQPEVAGNLLQSGRINLSTIARENSGIIFDNKENLSLALMNASQEERDKYAQGMKEAEGTKLSQENLAKLPDDSPLTFYRTLHSTLENAGDSSEVTAWEDQLLHGGKTAVSSLVEAQTDHWFVDKTHTSQALFSAAENLSADAWKQLQKHRSPDDPYWTELKNSLGTYASAKEQQNLIDLLQRKAGAESFEQSKSIHRSTTDTIEQNLHHVGRGSITQLSDQGKINVLDAIASMSPADTAKYKTDTSFKGTVDRTIPLLTKEQQIYANALLKQVEETGKPAVVSAELQVLWDHLHNVPAEQAISHIKTALQDQELRQRLSQPANSLTATERLIKRAVIEQTQDLDDESRKILLEKGSVPVGSLIKAGLPMTTDTYREIAESAAGTSKRDLAINALSKNPSQLAIALNVIHQGGILTEVDLARSFAIGDKVSVDELKAELENKDINHLRNEYARQYQDGTNDLDSDLLKAAAPKDREAIEKLLQASPVDANHSLYDHVLHKDRSGITADGTKETLSRASQDFRERVGEANKKHIDLTASELEKIEKYFATTNEQYQKSKRALADVVTQTGITVGSLAAVPFTGGLSLGGLALIAATGGGADLATHALIEGHNYDSNKALKDLAGGATMTAAMFAGGELTARVLGVGKEVAGAASENVIKLADNIVTKEGTRLLSPDRQLELKEAMQKLVQEKLGSGRDVLDNAELQKLAAKFASHPESAQDVQAISNLMRMSLSEQLGSRMSQATESLRLQGLGFGSGGAAMGLSEIDPRQSAGENLKRVGEGAAFGAIASVVPAAGAVLKRAEHTEGKVLAGGAHEIAGSGEQQAGKVTGKLEASPPAVLDAGKIAQSPEFKRYAELAERSGLSPERKQRFLERLALFQETHPGFKVKEPPAVARLDDETLAKQVKMAAMENSVGSFEMATRDYSNEIMNRAGMEAHLHTLERTGQLGKNEAVLVNLKNFKAANDTFDHQTGDMVLHAMSKYLHSAGFEGSLPVKLQGDAFILIGPQGQAKQVEDLLANVKIYATEDGVVLSGNAANKPLTITVDKSGNVSQPAQPLMPPAGKNVVVTAFKDREVSMSGEAGAARPVNEILDNIYGNGPKPTAPEVTIEGIGTHARQDGRADRLIAEEARAKLNSSGSVSDSIMEMVHAGALENGQMTRQDLVTTSAVLQAEENEAAAAYMLERGTGLIAKEHYEYTLASQAGEGEVSGLIVADVKGFGGLNGLSYFNRNALGGGRLVGDAGIEVMSDALREAVKKANLPAELASKVTLARIGGDEIGVILPHGISDAERERIVSEMDSIRLAV